MATAKVSTTLVNGSALKYIFCIPRYKNAEALYQILLKISFNQLLNLKLDTYILEAFAVWVNLMEKYSFLYPPNLQSATSSSSTLTLLMAYVYHIVHGSE